MAKRPRVARTLRSAGLVTYPDTGQTVAYAEWSDGTRTTGRPDNGHMQALLRRAEREGTLRHKVF